MTPLSQNFYKQSALIGAKSLLGKTLVRTYQGEDYGFKIVEVEAYMGILDKAAHAFGGKKTNRTAPMFEAGGIAYIYLIYGMYNCLNIVMNEEEIPECILIRAVEPLDQRALDFAKANRQMKSKKMQDLTNGPGKLCRALRIDKTLNAKPVNKKGALWLAEGEAIEGDIVEAKRINIPYAEEYQDKLWRFYIKDSSYVSMRDSH
ncbi:3-methyladenine DNA glycosylase [Sporanaerobium hydrogeniformans]|uniref:3-methyladenine DNA glycosylase n=1 Tax=Sporanaerobium hydrogeniformans TaxID=3072179 RepID=A0AC61DG91_9FIRM|nr:DNA-3-methyladenine glycosylase [Sporanaerobium hydrogeniformans]PHV71870.1 3-methyladenine DNA glycosylase [Sporanaerobium hydrogeniformans]